MGQLWSTQTQNTLSSTTGEPLGRFDMSDREIFGAVQSHNHKNAADMRTRSETMLASHTIVRRSSRRETLAACLADLDIQPDSQMYTNVTTDATIADLKDKECNFTRVKTDDRFTWLRVHKSGGTYEISLYSDKDQPVMFGTQLEFDRYIRDIARNKMKY